MRYYRIMKNLWKTKSAKRKAWSINAVRKRAALRVARGETAMTADPDEKQPPAPRRS